jgi:hypothetical protein
MQDQAISRATPAHRHLHSTLFTKTTPWRPAILRRPEPAGLTRAQLRDIVLEQIG